MTLLVIPMLHCFQIFFDGFLKWFQIQFYHIPEEFETDLIIIVNKDMSHSTYQMPLHIRVRFLEILRHLIYRLILG